MDMSVTGRAKGTTPESGSWTRLIGYNPEQFLQTILYRDIEKTKIAEGLR